jgi:hypothetical protein
MDQKTIFAAIAEGFRKTPREATVSLMVIVLIICLMSLVPLLYKKILRSKLRKQWQSEYNKQIRELDLTINEIDLLESMALFLANPYRKTLLLNNRNTFHKALSFLKKERGIESVYAQSLIKKLFTEDQMVLPEGFEHFHKTGRPARFVAQDGSVYSGSITKGQDDSIILGNIKKWERKEQSGLGRLFVQDYRGINSHPVSGVTKLDKDSLKLDLSREGNYTRKHKLSLSEIYIYPLDGSPPVKSNLRLLSKRLGVIENTDQKFKTGQTVKVAFHKKSKEIYRVNGIVKSISRNKKYATLQFGYLKKSC